MKESKDVLQYLQEEAEKLEIPESITPEQIRKRLEISGNGEIAKGEKEVEVEKSAKELPSGKIKKKFLWRTYFPMYITAAACVCLFVITLFVQRGGNIVNFDDKSFSAEHGTEKKSIPSVAEASEAEIEGSVEVREEELAASMDYPEITYEDIYESMFGNSKEVEKYSSYRGEIAEGAAAGRISAEEEMAVTPTINETAGNVIEYAAAEDLSAGVLPDSAVSEKVAVEESAVEHGITNVQTVGVEEGDVVKNDGRFLYQKIYQEKDHVLTQAIQIVDTKDHLSEVRRIEGFDNIQEFYIWEDVLVIIENKYLENTQPGVYAAGGAVMCGVEGLSRYSRQYHEITFYNIKDRSVPRKIKTFTLKGSYDSSRISDGYFYGFSKFYASPGEGENDYDAYVPQIDGIRLDTSRILLPEKNEGNCYLVLVSIDMKNPTQFTETTAIVTDSDMYYVSSDNIYIADSIGFVEETGRKTNRISLLRFSYKKGNFALQAEGEVKGSLESSFSMDEYEGNLRMVTTVDEYRIESLKDDRTGEVIGTHVTDSRRSNALYVLNQELEVIGKIENLAKDEQIYSARFLKETGYFVTFRQTDPLFAVDLKDPKNPKILSELKISGFSEYLHFYGEDRLLGIGMEADEETGITEGMKLSMFDISNPADVQEVSKVLLSQYYHSEVLYNHRAVLISPGANIFGFEAEGRENGNHKKDYLVFSYENDKFVQKLKIETNSIFGDMYSSRGTFIGDVFYLLIRDGSVESYDLNTGKKLDEL